VVGVGALVDFENDLGLPENDVIGVYTLRWRISQRWQLDAEYFNLKREHDKQLSRTLQWGDFTFPVNASLQSSFKFSDLRIGGGYSFFRTTDKEIGAGLGVHVTRFEASLSATNVGTEQVAKSAPLPTFSLYGII